MNIAITGASGLLGKALGAALRQRGDSVLEIGRARFGAKVSPDFLTWDPSRGELDGERLDGVDAVIHLAGENVGAGRWTPQRKDALRKSRIESTALLARTLAGRTHPPRVLISASAVGFYGNRADLELDEGAAMGEGFLAEICRDWEAETRDAQRAGIRTVQTRFGVVLSKHGGALAKMLLPFKFGLGGRVGSGKQWMSFVALDDVVRAILHILGCETLAGPVNVVTPRPVTNAEFTKALGSALSRPTLFPVPALAIRTLFGEMGEQLLLASQRVIPKRLTTSGFSFAHPDITSALAAALRG